MTERNPNEGAADELAARLLAAPSEIGYEVGHFLGGIVRAFLIMIVAALVLGAVIVVGGLVLDATVL